MARPRKPEPKPARQRNYAEEYQRRVKGTEPGSAERKKARGHEKGEGHRGEADLLRFIRSGTMIKCDVRSVTVTGSDAGRRWLEIPKLAIPDLFEKRRRNEREFVLRGPRGRGYDETQLRALLEREVARGAKFSPQPSLDQRRLLDY